MNYQLGGADFTTAEALTIALACVAVIVSFFAIAKTCEKFLQKKEGMNQAVVLSDFSLETRNRGAVLGGNQGGTVSNLRVGENLGDAAVTASNRWVKPVHEHMSLPKLNFVDKLKQQYNSTVASLKESFVAATDNSQQQRNGNFVTGQNIREHLDTCVGSGFPKIKGQACEGYRPGLPMHAQVANVDRYPDGTIRTREGFDLRDARGNKVREGMCTLYPDGKCREHYTQEDHWVASRNDPSDKTIYVHPAPGLSADSSQARNIGVVQERFDPVAGSFISTVDEMAYQCSPMNNTVTATPAGGQLGYLRLVPQDAEQALGAELPFDTNDLNQAELTNTTATNVDVGQLLLKFGPDEITSNNVALVGEDGFIARELRYNKKPVVLTDGVNTYTLNTYEDWANFQYNPVNSGATADMGVENALESYMPNVRRQGWTLASPHEYMSRPQGRVTTARSRVPAGNFM